MIYLSVLTIFKLCLYGSHRTIALSLITSHYGLRPLYRPPRPGTGWMASCSASTHTRLPCAVVIISLSKLDYGLPEEQGRRIGTLSDIIADTRAAQRPCARAPKRARRRRTAPRRNEEFQSRGNPMIATPFAPISWRGYGLFDCKKSYRMWSSFSPKPGYPV